MSNKPLMAVELNRLRQRVAELEDEIRSLCDENTKLDTENEAFFKRHQNRPKLVCLCGSTRFMDAFYETGWQLTLDGYIVLGVGVCKHAEDHGGEALGQDVADRLDELHLRKSDLADWVLVLNVNKYIGESTRREIDYAVQQGKRLSYLEPKEVDHG